jgi:hypothetical protein
MVHAGPEHMPAVRTEDLATISVRVECGTAAVVGGPAVQSTAGEREQFEHVEPRTNASSRTQMRWGTDIGNRATRVSR